MEDLSGEAHRMSDALRNAKEDATITEASRMLRERLATKRAEREQKAAERAAWLKEYHEQLAKGNSNRDKGAKKARRSRARKMDPARFPKPG